MSAFAVSRGPASAPSSSRKPVNYDGERVKWRNHTVYTPETYFGQIRYQPGGYCGPRIQRDYQLVVIHSGSCRVTVDDLSRDIEIGEVALFVPGGHELFAFSADRETNHSWCSIRPHIVPPDLRKQLDRAPPSTGTSILFERLIRSTLDYGESRSENGSKVINSIGLTLFAEYLRCCDAGKRVPTDAPVIKAIKYMTDHLEESDCLEGACGASACSRTALIKKFHQSIGETPGRHLWHLRTEKGIGMLRNTGLTVSEISEQCGFSNPYHFSRRIRATTGVSPRALRDAAWGR